jgi:beta-1,2-mannobiose phosphorylase / 1,2-beta-oligomannan phosphorylase
LKWEGLKSPLLVPNATEREGYVPNVVYTCGSMIKNDDLIIPYAMSDYASTYATVNVRELLNELKNSKPGV